MDSDEREELLGELKCACVRLNDLPAFITDGGVHLALAAEGARMVSETVSCDAGGVPASETSGLVSALMTVRRFDSDICAAAEIRYSDAAAETAEKLLMEVRSPDPSRRPAGISTMDWETAFLCRPEDVPDVIVFSDADAGGAGRGYIRFFGMTMRGVLNNIHMLSERINNKN